MLVVAAAAAPLKSTRSLTKVSFLTKRTGGDLTRLLIAKRPSSLLIFVETCSIGTFESFMVQHLLQRHLSI